ncbi:MULTISPECIES: replication initiation and membrane attachment family protein [unclassified Exiguobacterium]|uniref:replication initiation and membrane attachment family protein n=1 Tax=unclassified Exiguobacterium TaxID=2644629 RepID=UPI0004530288|nr:MULTISPECIES: DnaD domain protein [unclassified Exiguobacterium]EZP60514.1 Replication initiation protein [Exiguobacterium sp. RIT341]
MVERELSGTDLCLVMSNGVVDREAYQSLYYLYQPIIGVKALGLYQTFWSEMIPGKTKSQYISHAELGTLLGFSVDEFKEELFKLEGIGLIRTFEARQAAYRYIYQIRVPLAPNTFLNDGVLSSLLFYRVGEIRFRSLQHRFRTEPLPKNIVDRTVRFDQVFDVKAGLASAHQPKAYAKQERAVYEFDYSFDLEEMKRQTDRFLPRTFYSKAIDHLLVKLAYVTQSNEALMAELLNARFRHEAYLPMTDAEKQERCKQMMLSAKQKLSREKKAKVASLDTIEVGDIEATETMESTHPKHYVAKLRKVKALSERDEELIQQLIIDYEMSSGIVNAAYYYALVIKKDNRFSKNFLLSIVDDWKQKGYVTASEALAKTQEQDELISKKQEQKQERARQTVGGRRGRTSNTNGGPNPKWLQEEKAKQQEYEASKKASFEADVPDDEEMERILRELKGN